MKMLRYVSALPLGVLMALMLSGCLEVQQNPAYIDGAYAGKPDQLSDAGKFHNDRLAQNAALNNRAQLENEYNRIPAPNPTATPTH